MYLDPGTGSMLIQILLAVFASGGAILFMVRRKIAKLFGKEIPLPESAEDDEALADDDFEMMDDEAPQALDDDFESIEDDASANF